ncbi:uncharacterized protein LOC118737579 [Rhagoletis pomonella]|uniref:uncharacterized protein LOC118737579 n=1 Tax=Rhagoletis pomonella TaxID=28610 RepID=UPI00177B8F33|nr:uncharacterized protein LOC118737579 [Rhagoletis pomonella]
MDSKSIPILWFLFFSVTITFCAALPIEEVVDLQLQLLNRARRQIDINLSAEHDDKEDETEIALEAIANLWRSADSKTQIEGAAKVVHTTSSQHMGNTHFSGRLHVHHDYRKKRKI